MLYTRMNTGYCRLPAQVFRESNLFPVEKINDTALQKTTFGKIIIWKLSGISVERALNQVRERGNKCGRVANGGHHLELFDAALVRLFARFEIDFRKRLDVFRDECDGYYEKIPFACCGECIDRIRQRRREPFAAAYFALKTERVLVFPTAAVHHQLHGFRNLARVRVAALNQAERQPCALKMMCARSGSSKWVSERFNFSTTA